MLLDHVIDPYWRQLRLPVRAGDPALQTGDDINPGFRGGHQFPPLRRLDQR
jgi:hypothetical protein